VFDTLSDKLQGVLGDLRKKGRLDEEAISRAMREIRLALLEADVNFTVVRDFVAHVRERALGEDVLKSLTPGQQVVKIVHEELTTLMGEGSSSLSLGKFSVILLAGLQGSGKTTTAAKLALALRNEGRKPGLVAADLQRPAAIDQLEQLGAQLGVPVFRTDTSDPVEATRRGIERARSAQLDTVIVDTAGRLQLDVEPDGGARAGPRRGEAGQRAARPRRDDRPGGCERRPGVRRADRVRRGDPDEARRRCPRRRSAEREGGDGEADQVRVDRREARSARGVPPRPHGVAHPRDGRCADADRARRAGGCRGRAAEMEKRMRAGQFTFDDFLSAYKMLRRMGPLQGILKMIPGDRKELGDMDVDEAQLGRVEAIVLSMTPQERSSPIVIDGKRRQRIARGSGATVEQVNQLLEARKGMEKMMKQMGRGEDAGSLDSRRPGRRPPRDVAAVVGETQKNGPAGGKGLKMAVKLRLTRVGSKKNPIYRVVAADARSPRDGRFLEIVGRYNPQTDPSTIELDETKVRDWLGKGAQPTEAVSRLLKVKGIS